ncbi:DUF3619 family protein [Nitrosospira sp. NpAV]|uniref:DUF3619 family protein n=1 Tax=Nitrosospira sp. NpAV TaxID=58133 RepID=UPI00059FB780|nr:DUF3619 family protein [Nitrosospira sp. NpAV]KIO49820.1 membrane protein [Nitrosospira sp. NpAV]
MNEPELGGKVARLLNHGLDDIKQSTLNQLQSARRAALQNYQVTGEIVTAGHGVSARGGDDWHLRTGKWLSLIMLLFAFASVVYWQTFQQGDDNEEIDIMLLVDDLPVNAYLDDEFDAWLDHP